MARTVQPRRGPQDTPSDAEFMPTAWNAHTPQGPGTRDLELPSGQKVLIRRVELDDLVREGVFMARPPSPLPAHMVDRVIAAVVMKPAIKVAPNSPVRDKTMIYTDVIGDADKAMILEEALL